MLGVNDSSMGMKVLARGVGSERLTGSGSCAEIKSCPKDWLQKCRLRVTQSFTLNSLLHVSRYRGGSGGLVGVMNISLTHCH